MLEFVLLGDPSIHPVGAAPAVATRGARRGAAAVPATPAATALAERQRRSVFTAALASQMGATLAVRSAASVADRRPASTRFGVVEQALGRETVAGFEMSREPIRVDRVEAFLTRRRSRWRVSRHAGAGRPRRLPRVSTTLQYHWSGKRIFSRHKEIRLVKVETDAKGQVLHHSVVQSG